MTSGQIKRDRRNRWIAVLYTGGLTERQIADVVGLSPARVDAILETLGIAAPPKSERPKNSRLTRKTPGKRLASPLEN